jgi:hypothetical protein
MDISLKKLPHDIAARVDAARRAHERTRGLDRAEHALAQKETVKGPGAVIVQSDNIAFVVDSEYLRVRGTRVIDGGERSVFVEEEAMDVKRVIVETYDIPGSIDRVRKRVGRTWEIYSGEAVSLRR